VTAPQTSALGGADTAGGPADPGPPAPDALRPGAGAAPGGGARHCATCSCFTAGVCTCGHPDVQHGFLNDRTKAGRQVRTACSVHEGRKGVPCGCLAYTPQEET
jgi:hypothetical protein